MTSGGNWFTTRDNSSSELYTFSLNLSLHTLTESITTHPHWIYHYTSSLNLSLHIPNGIYHYTVSVHILTATCSLHILTGTYLYTTFLGSHYRPSLDLSLYTSSLLPTPVHILAGTDPCSHPRWVCPWGPQVPLPLMLMMPSSCLFPCDDTTVSARISVSQTSPSRWRRITF